MELNWLPDHAAVAEIAGDLGRHLSGEDAQKAVGEIEGLIPAAIDPEARAVIWADVGQNDLQEWQFLFSLAAMAESGKLLTLRTNLDELPDLEAALGDTVEPAGFIFHMSRCGSTLLGNALNRPPQHLAINQPGPLQDGFWTVITDHWRATADRSDPAREARHEQLLRHLLRAILRRRSADHVRAFVKFRSWSVLFVRMIEKAFPEVPCLFMYRDPIEVFGSTLQKKNVAEFAGQAQKAFLTGRDETDLPELTTLQFMNDCYANYFRAALSSRPDRMTLLNYRDLKRGNLRTILRDGFRLEGDLADLDLMADEFGYYSKDRNAEKSTFDAERDRRAKAAKLEAMAPDVPSPTLTTLYRRLERAGNNLFPAARA